MYSKNMDSLTSFPQLNNVRTRLRKDSENTVVQMEELQLFECLANSIEFTLSRLPDRNNGTDKAEVSNTIRYYKTSENIKTRVVDLLKKHPKQLQPVFNILVDNVHMQDEPKDHGERMYDMVIKDCRMGYNYQIYVKLFLYAAATCINTPFYILEINEIGDLQWAYYQPLFRYEEQPRCVIKYLTMYMSPMKTFFRIEHHDISAPAPIATGLLGMYLKMLKGRTIRAIDVPNVLLDLPAESKFQLCGSCNTDIVRQCCELFRVLGLIQMEDFRSMTVHRASKDTFQRLGANSPDAFQIVCQVVISRREKTILAPFVGRWESFVSSCNYLRQFQALVALDSAVYDRNVAVIAFGNSCLIGGREFDERRKKVTTAVISSSSFGIVSGGLIIAGIVLAPVSFGTSLGLSIAGGAIGIGAGATAGTARTVEAVKRNKTMKLIKTQQAQMHKKEKDVADSMRDVENLFQVFVRNEQDAENEELERSWRGFLAVGSALRATHGGFGIGLAAAQMTASAATLSAAVLGPLSLVLDIAFLTEAAYNKAKGDKTNTGEILQSIAETMGTKSKIFNSILRGNFDVGSKMFKDN
ncbi:uncharacterized protein LOC123523763 [Mercenaria mercenaria]|uniref:uncharacterized protein LOC123523763 n=1 Tax=Mercenaria mercenaria TaxID=6596 RepID=UPI00234F3ABB|nr:uncharacterized protein LOC123523763 [Mercenaria mercenaria]